MLHPQAIFIASFQKSGTLFKLVPEFLSLQGKVLHHSAAYNPRRNQYLVTWDFDVDSDNLPDQLYALRVDTEGNIVDKRILNYTANINRKAGILGQLSKRRKGRKGANCIKPIVN